MLVFYPDPLSVAQADAAGAAAVFTEVLGVRVGDSETEAFWSEFLRSLRERGLGGVRLVISDSHSGLVSAIRKVVLGASWQRCRVH